MSYRTSHLLGIWLLGVLIPTLTLAAASKATLDLGAMFSGTWNMEGRFRQTPDMEWIPTRSKLVAESKIGGHVVVRDIDAPQINLSAIDMLTYNPKTGVVQYVYLYSGDTTALVFEGSCHDADCRKLEFEQVCPPSWQYPSCDGRTSIAFESETRFVARDSRPGPGGEYFVSREVYYTRAEP